VIRSTDRITANVTCMVVLPFFGSYLQIPDSRRVGRTHRSSMSSWVTALTTTLAIAPEGLTAPQSPAVCQAMFMTSDIAWVWIGALGLLIGITQLVAMSTRILFRRDEEQERGRLRQEILGSDGGADPRIINVGEGSRVWIDASGQSVSVRMTEIRTTRARHRKESPFNPSAITRSSRCSSSTTMRTG
jgi:hypothetical protein